MLLLAEVILKGHEDSGGNGGGIVILVAIVFVLWVLIFGPTDKGKK